MIHRPSVLHARTHRVMPAWARCATFRPARGLARFVSTAFGMRMVLVGFVTALALLALLEAPARAHSRGISQSELVVDGDRVVAHVVFSASDAERLVGSPTPFELADLLRRGIAVSADGDDCAARFDGGGVTEQDGVALDATFTCPSLHASHAVDPPAGATDGSHVTRTIAVVLYFLTELPPGHRHLARLVRSETTAQATLDDAHRVITLTFEDRGDAPQRDVSPNGAHMSTRSGALAPAVVLGIAHVLTGWDHLLFLFALLLGTTKPRALVPIVTTFTLAHSLTLALAALGIVVLPAWIVEPSIAASIAVVAIMSAGAMARTHTPPTDTRRGLERGASGANGASGVSALRPSVAIVFGFGLLHGFGFAAALRDLALPSSRLVPTLLGFNLGVEIGQLGALALAAPLLHIARARGWLTVRSLRALSVGIAAIGVVVCLERAAALL